MNNDYKFALVNSGLLKKCGTRNEYRCNCPYCGETDGKFYMYIDLDSDASVRYNCFKCPAQGNQVSIDLLKRLGIENVIIPREAGVMKPLLLDSGVRVSENIQTMLVDENTDVGKIGNYLKSIIDIRRDVDLNDLVSFQYIGNCHQFVKDYLGESKIDMLNGRDHWWKLSNGNIVCYCERGWLSYQSKRIRKEGIYQMKTLIDLCQPVNVIVSDSIFDVIGLYYNFENDLIDNRMYIACMGKPYVYALWHMIAKGIFGKSVNIHIFLNNGVEDNQVWINEDIKKLFGKICVYRNANGGGYLTSQLNIRRTYKR